MRTTLDIDARLIEKAMVATGAKSKKRAIEIALTELLRATRRRELRELIGNYDGFTLTLKKLKEMRDES
jgi:Arc/MetJ family transcription regulator